MFNITIHLKSGKEILLFKNNKEEVNEFVEWISGFIAIGQYIELHQEKELHFFHPDNIEMIHIEEF